MSLDNLDLEQIYGTGVQPPVAPYIPQQMSQEDLQQAMGIPAPVSTDSTQQSPTNSPLPFQAKPVLNGGSIEQGGSASYSGFSPEKYNQITKTSSIVDKRVAKDMAPVTDMLKKQEQDYSAIAKDRIKNQQNVTDIEKQKADINSQYEMDKADIINKGNLAIQNEIETGRQNVATAMANHQKMMEQFQAMSVNPGDLYNRMTTGERAGTSLAVAASAFLGAKGIGTPIMGIIDKAIDRNIDAQLANIKKKGQEVGMAADVVNMVRQTSRDDLEAKMRLKDMALESAAQGLTAEFSKFGSKLAEAKGAEAVAMIKEQQLKVRDDLNKQWLDAENVSRGQRISEHNNEVNASVERAGIASRERIAALEHQAKMGDPIENAAKEAVWDTSEGATKGWLWQPGITDEEKKQVRAQLAANSELTSILKEAAELSAELGPKYRGVGEKYFTTADKARFDQFRNVFVMTYKKALTGLQGSDKEMAAVDQMLTPDSLLNKEKFAQLAGQMQQLRKNNSDNTLKMYTRDMPAGMEKVLRDSGYGPSATPQDSLGTSRIGEGGWGSVVTTPGNNSVDNVPEEARTETQKAWDNLNDKVIKRDSNVTDEENKAFVSMYYNSIGKDYSAYVTNQTGEITRAQQSIIRLGLNARAGDTVALDYLNQVANEKSGLTGKYSGITEDAKFAQYMINNLGLSTAQEQDFSSSAKEFGKKLLPKDKSYSDQYLESR